MAMNVGSSSSDDDVIMEINTTPLIDVMLVLLIMLIITIPVQTHAVKLNMPVNAQQQPAKPPPVVEISIDFDGTVLWNGESVANSAELESRLRAVASEQEQPEVHLRPNKLAAYKYVATVMASAQRLGVTKIGFVGNEQFAD
ncbi:MAG: biopolymer transporter ExbD [Nevskia sp.]|nr:biopolymer transporter ExbD [Nevskia sp.]